MGQSDNFSTLVVANPQSANGALGRKWTAFERVIHEQYGPFDHQFTAAAGDATAITRKALSDRRYEMIVAMGGDGTISEVTDGFFTGAGPVNTDAVLGVLPFGTGGDFRKTIGVSKHLDEGAAALRGKWTRRIDVGRLTYTDHQGGRRVRHFVNIASFGIGGLVDQIVNTTTKALGGRVSFAIATLRGMSRFRPQVASMRLDNGDAEQVTLQNVAVANGKYFGGGMKIAPDAELDDGLFDVVTLPPMGLWDAATKMGRLYNGTHLELPGVRFARAHRVEAEPVDPAEAILLDVDGETPGRLPALFEVLPGALILKLPEVP